MKIKELGFLLVLGNFCRTTCFSSIDLALLRGVSCAGRHELLFIYRCHCLAYLVSWRLL